MNRLTAEVGFDKGKTTYHYNEKGELTTQAYWGSNGSPQALRETHFKRDTLGRIVQESISQQNGLSAQTDYQYDGLGRITQLSDGENTQGFDYDKVGRLRQQRQYHLNANGMVESQALHYHYDRNGNRTKLTLPNKDEISYLYYGSGHLSAIKYNDSLITEISRGKLHQELTRTQGKLTTQFKRDPLGRLAQQLAVLESSHTPLVQRSYEYDLVGNLIQTQDKRFGTTNYRYDKLGQIQLAGQELFQFDPAHNIIERESERIQNNQVTTYQGVTYRYDEFGNLSQRTLPNGEVQSYRYNAKDKLVEVTIQKPKQTIETWQYQYDVLGRRISKRLENGENLQETRFVWDGSHLVQEENANSKYSYIYTHPSSYEPLAQLAFAKNSANPTACYYYHNDQIGVPRELTDEQGNLCWYGDYTGWGKLKDEYALVENIHQPFRLQNQYADEETSLHYNFFRYYEPNVGRFTQLDPIGLAGGENLYRFEGNIQNQTDPLGLFAPAAGYAGYMLWGMLFGTTAAIGIHGTMEAMESTDSSSSKTSSVTTDVSKCSEEEKKKRCKKWGMGTPAQAQNKVRKQQAPRGIYRIDGPEEYVPYSQWHAHASNNSALNQDGTVHDKHRGYPPFSRDDKDFLFCHGWNI